LCRACGCGKWLESLGIEPGPKIRVITNGMAITLAPVSVESEKVNVSGRTQP
jgi:hypothetical protein